MTVGLAVALTLAGLTVGIVAGLPSGTKPRAAGARYSYSLAAERAAIAASFAYPSPLRCLRLTRSHSQSAAAKLQVSNRCGRLHGYINASVHRIQRSWNLVLDESRGP